MPISSYTMWVKGLFTNSNLKLFCQPPVLLEDISTEGLSPDILVAGDIISKKYDFMMGDLDNNPYKIAQVFRYLHLPDTAILSLSPGYSEVQDDSGEQHIFPQCWPQSGCGFLGHVHFCYWWALYWWLNVDSLFLNVLFQLSLQIYLRHQRLE